MGFIEKRLACALALLLALALAGSALAASSAGGTSVGILVERAEPADPDVPPQSGDSVLGVLVAPEGVRDLTVTFLVKVDSHEEAYRVDTLEYGARAVAPAGAPAWPLDTWPGKDDGAAPPVFDRWCADEAATHAWDFDEPVTRSLVLYAAFSQGEKVEVVLDANWPGAGAPERIWRYPGSPYRELPVPVRVGHVFQGWRTAPDDAGDLVDSEGIVPQGGVTLYASWRACEYRVRYVKNLEAALGPAWVADDSPKRYGEAFEVAENAFFTAPANVRFMGWRTVAVPTEAVPGELYLPGDSALDLAVADGAWVDLYAQWEEVPVGSFQVTFVANGGAWEEPAGGVPDGTELVLTVPAGSKLPQPGSGEEGAIAVPKRTGYQVGAWVRESGAAWGFDRDVVTGDLTLHARWDLRLDVTVPVSVAFAVDAATGEAAGPGEGAYALKSRTVAPVEVESLALESRQGELEGFFALAEGASWAGALAGTELSLAPAGADAVGLPFAGEEDAGLWRHERPLAESERASWRLAAFDYGALAADDAWQGADPSEQLPLVLALSISDDLEVLTGQEGPVPIARLRVTLSATP